MQPNISRFLPSIHRAFYSRYLTGLLFLFLFSLRFIHISADPPADLSWSGGLFFDEGALAHNARNKVLFGQWKLDEWNDFYYSPLLTYVKWAAFSLLGVGLAQERVVPIAFSCLTLWVLYLSLKAAFSRSTAFLGTFLLGFNYVYLMYSRIGLTETPLLLAAVLTLYFWQKGLQSPISPWSARGYLFLAGVSCFTVYIFKTLLIYFLPVPGVAMVFLGLSREERAERKRLLILTSFFMLGMVVTAGLWLALFYYPNYQPIHEAGDFVGALLFPKSFRSFLDNVYRTPFFSIFFRTPITLIVALGYLLYLVYLMFHKRSKLHPVDLFMGCWFMAHLLFFAGLSYRPTRYYVPIIPAMSVLAARGILGMVQLRQMEVPPKTTPWFWGLFGLVGGILWAYVLIPLAYLYGAIPFVTVPPLSGQGNLVLGTVLSLLITGWMVWWIWKHRGNSLPVPHQILQGIAILLLLTSVYMNGFQYYRWASNPQYVVRDTSRELGTLLEDAFIAGLATPTLCLENTHKALYVWEGFFNYRDTLKKYAITHLFLGEFNDEVGYYRRKFPGLMRRAKLLKVYWIKGSRFHLYSVIEPSIEEIRVREPYDLSEPVEVMVEVKNNDPRKSKEVEVGWFLQPITSLPLAESLPLTADLPSNSEMVSNSNVFSVRGRVHLDPLEESTVTLSKKVPPGSYGLMATLSTPEQHVYEAETLKGLVGRNEFDPHASKGEARFGDHKENPSEGFLVYGPYRIYPAGKFETGFKLKYSRSTTKTSVNREDPIAVIDVVTNTGRTVLAKKALRKQDFEQMDTYQTFRLSYFLKSSQPLEFRVFTYGQVDLWVDTITTAFIRGEWHPSPIRIQ